MKINCLRCNTCDDLITSRANHDFNQCSCGAIFVDGGMLWPADEEHEENWGFYRIGGARENWSSEDIELDVTPAQLYNDWNSQENKYVKLNNLGKKL